MVKARDVMKLMTALDPFVADDAGSLAVVGIKTLRPFHVVIGDARHGQGDFTFEHHAGAHGIELLAERGGAFLHRVEKNSVGVQRADYFAERINI